MNDYINNIKTKNINKKIINLMKPFFDRLRSKKETEGIVKLGGLGTRGFSDVYSDVDASVFVKKSAKWLPMFEFYVPIPDKQAFYEINVHQNNLKREYSRKWEEGKKEAYTEGIIVYDDDNKVKKLIKNKLKFYTQSSQERKKLLSQSILSFKKSKDPLNDHLTINKMFHQAIEIVFLHNKKFMPHKKWRIQKAKSLSLTPLNFEGIIKEIMAIKRINSKDVERRAKALKNLILFYTKERFKDYPEKENPPKEKSNKKSYSEKTKKKMIALICGQFYWTIDVNPLRQIKRGFIINGHDLLNEGLASILESIRIIKNKKIRHHLECLNVLSPYPEYEESNYRLFEPENYPLSKKDLINALRIKNFSDKELRRRVKKVQKISRSILGWIRRRIDLPNDPYHFAIANCYFDRQLRKKPYAEVICPPKLSKEDTKLFEGFINYHLISSKKELLFHLKNPTKDIYSTNHLIKIGRISRKIKGIKNDQK